MTEPPTLTLEGFTLRYRTGFGVGPVDAKLPVGLYHLRGGNGSGKTTLLRGITGELRAKKGSCKVNGRDVWRDHAARALIGYLPASPDQPDFLTLREAARLGAATRGAPGWDLARFADELSLDLDMRIAHMSSGQRRRAELVCALAGDPPVLLLDEPFANLDTQGVEALSRWCQGWRASRVVVLTSHGDLPLEPDASWDVRPNEALRFGAPVA
jgi:ABC-type multidrug transport system ATPase subunit